MSVEVATSPQTLKSVSAAVRCPVCENDCESPPLYCYDSREAAAHFCPETRDRDRNARLRQSIARLWNGESCSVYRCAECGFGFGYPFVGGDEDFYSILHEQRGYPVWRWDYDTAIEKAINCYEGGNVLDVGAGVGNFLTRLPNTWSRFAVEASELNRRDLEARGITQFARLADAAKSGHKSFRVITLFQVLEHISDFSATLELCARLLAPDGRLVITVPDCDAMIRQEKLTGCHDMPPNHVAKWTKVSLSLALNNVGLGVERVVDEPSSWSNVKASLHMRLMVDASNPHTASAHVYRIRNKRFRTVALAALAVPTLLRLSPYLGELRLGGAFGVVAMRKSELIPGLQVG